MGTSTEIALSTGQMLRLTDARTLPGKPTRDYCRRCFFGPLVQRCPTHDHAAIPEFRELQTKTLQVCRGFLVWAEVPPTTALPAE